MGRLEPRTKIRSHEKANDPLELSPIEMSET